MAHSVILVGKASCGWSSQNYTPKNMNRIGDTDMCQYDLVSVQGHGSPFNSSVCITCQAALNAIGCIYIYVKQVVMSPPAMSMQCLYFSLFAHCH